ncbi:hypothetical protein [Nitrosospira sp. Nsp11]|uniref:hypothetical protein n=1 Tax=Nitrosospira sp. Nsp11 TaxID=1855338 RepID=UPI0011602459|nr:hypothetical protein [Nitrosospira sp. Nsp11]
MFLLTGFNLWGPSSFEECRDQAAREAKTEAGMGILIRSCRKQFPKLSELKGEWARFARVAKNYRYDRSIPAARSEPTNRTGKDYGEFFADKYGGKSGSSLGDYIEDMFPSHQTAEGRAELLASKKFMNWFIGQPDYLKALVVSPMLQANEDKIFEAYGATIY